MDQELCSGALCLVTSIGMDCRPTLKKIGVPGWAQGPVVGMERRSGWNQARVVAGLRRTSISEIPSTHHHPQRQVGGSATLSVLDSVEVLVARQILASKD